MTLPQQPLSEAFQEPAWLRLRVYYALKPVSALWHFFINS